MCELGTLLFVINRTGPTPSPFEALKLGMGQKQKLRKFKFGSTGSKTDGHVTVDPEGTTCWLAPGAEPGGVSEWGWKRDPGWTLGVCVWALHRVYARSTYLCFPSLLNAERRPLLFRSGGISRKARFFGLTIFSKTQKTSPRSSF